MILARRADASAGLHALLPLFWHLQWSTSADLEDEIPRILRVIIPGTRTPLGSDIRSEFGKDIRSRGIGNVVPRIGYQVQRGRCVPQIRLQRKLLMGKLFNHFFQACRRGLRQDRICFLGSDIRSGRRFSSADNEVGDPRIMRSFLR